MNSLPWVINGIVEAIVSLRRINSISHITTKSPICSIPYDVLCLSNGIIEIKNVDFTWADESEAVNENELIIFKDVHLEIKEVNHIINNKFQYFSFPYNEITTDLGLR